MAKLDVPPTKSQLLDLKRGLEFSRSGYELLDQKRTILTIELTGRLDAVRNLEAELDQLLAEAFETLREAALEAGSEALERQSFASLGEHNVEVRSRPLMGLPLPQLETEYADMPPQFGAMGSSARVDEVRRIFAEVLKLVGRMAELQNLVVRLARELRKTQRRTNALSRIFIPNYEETIKYITETLEERERESVAVMKMIKARQTAARDRAD